ETTDYSFETLSRRFQEMAFLNKGLRINLTDERESAKATAGADEAGEDEKHEVKHVSYYYEGGIVDFVKYLNSRKGDVVHPTVIDLEAEDKDKHLSLEVAMQWNGGYTEGVYSFANIIHTHEGGTHEEGFRAALTSLINKYARGRPRHPPPTATRARRAARPRRAPAPPAPHRPTRPRAPAGRGAERRTPPGPAPRPGPRHLPPGQSCAHHLE